MTVTTLPPAAQTAALGAAAQGRPGRPVMGGVRVMTPTAAASAPAPASAAEPEQLKTIESVLAAAEASDQQRLRTKAARLREMSVELTGLVELEAEAKKLKAEVAQLRKELSRAETRLRTLRHPATTPSTASTAEVTRAVRAWAKAQNIEVNDHGRVPNALIERWRTETGGAP